VTGLFAEPHGATPLDDEDIQGLLRTDIALRSELNLAEAENIASAQSWAFSRPRVLAQLLTRAAMKELHRRMFGDVWRWAGTIRQRQTNTGSSPGNIVTELENLLLDVRTQIADPARPAWPPDEIAVRFHHRLVSIHPFPNGNGRHARLAADLLVVRLGRRRFTWGSSGDLADDTTARTRYLNALRVADRDYTYESLLEFSRS
jgi:Fic-DOC domain mobile mystery protein B